MVLKAKKNIVVKTLFGRYLNRLVSRNYSHINCKNLPPPGGGSILLLANHYSWWDAFVLYYINSRYLKKNFYLLVSAENYRKQWFFKYLGAFANGGGARGSIATLGYAAQLLKQPGNLVIIFPQGRLCHNYCNKVVFKSGTPALLKMAGPSCQVWFIAAFTNNFSHKKPYVNAWFKHYLPQGVQNNVASAYQHFFSSTKQREIEYTE